MHAYSKAIQTCLAARAVWEPGELVMPGDYGVIRGGCFVRMGSVTDIGVRLSRDEVVKEEKYELSRKLASSETIKATTSVSWIGKALASVGWGGGEGVFLGAPSSELLTIPDLGRVVRDALSTERWGFSWRLVRQVRLFEHGVVVLADASSAEGRLNLESVVPTHEGSFHADTRERSGFTLIKKGITGAVYAHVVRLRPWLSHGAAPLDHELWYDDDLEDDEEQ
jgi:hypothetical protein